MKRVKQKFHNILQGLGVDLIRHRPHDPAPSHTVMDLRRLQLLSRLKIDVLLDVGANSGQYASGVRGVGYRGKIISFEPIAAPYSELSAKIAGDPLWEAHPIGLGPSPANTIIHVAGNNAESSSLLEMCAQHIEQAPAARYVAEETVRIETLDGISGKLFQPTDRLWLKLDVQGYEFPVLEGAKATLKQVIGLEVELSLVQLYEGQPLLREALGRIEAMGFQLIGVEEVFSDSQQLRTLQLNGVFERTET